MWAPYEPKRPKRFYIGDIKPTQTYITKDVRTEKQGDTTVQNETVNVSYKEQEWKEQ